ncbi:MAG: PAS domain-containing sensor histidine kinase, partial [Verrucomicrobiaceae bacterium]
TDITDSKRADEALRLTEERNRALMEQAPFSIQILAPDGHTLRVNRAWEELWGLTLEQISEYNMLRDPELETKGLMPYIKRAFAGEAVEIPVVQYDPNHSVPNQTSQEYPRRWVSSVAYPIRARDGQLQEIVLVHQDITARTNAEIALKQRETELRGSEARFRTVVDGAPVAISVSRTGQTLYVNPAYRECFGIGEQEEMEGRSILEQIAPEEHERIRDHVRRRYAGEPVPDSYEFVGMRSDGSRFPVQLEVGQIELSDGPASIAFITDITERRRAEAALRDADRRKNEFLATLAHELRNPLAPIRNAVEILNLQGPPDPTLQATRDMINRQIDHMTRLIDDLLDVSRITLGKLELRRKPVLLSTVIEQALETSLPHVHCGGHELSVKLPSHSIHLEADPVRLGQVFSNLLNNACKYTEKGGRIQLFAEQEDHEVVVTVKDT